MDKRSEARNKGLIRNSLQRAINRNSEIIKNKELLKGKTKELIEEAKLNITQERLMKEIDATLEVFEEKFEEVYEEFIDREIKKQARVELPNESLTEMSNRFSMMVQDMKNNMSKERMQYLQFRQGMNEKTEEYRRMLEEHKTNETKKKKTLKVREIHCREMGPEQEIEWDR